MRQYHNNSNNNSNNNDNTPFYSLAHKYILHSHYKRAGVEVGVSDHGSELHVDRPDAAQAGYTQAGVDKKGVVPNVIPAHFSMIAIESLLQP